MPPPLLWFPPLCCWLLPPPVFPWSLPVFTWVLLLPPIWPSRACSPSRRRLSMLKGDGLSNWRWGGWECCDEQGGDDCEDEERIYMASKLKWRSRSGREESGDTCGRGEIS